MKYHTNEVIINNKFAGVGAGMTGVINLSAILSTYKDDKAFLKTIPSDFANHD